MGNSGSNKFDTTGLLKTWGLFALIVIVAYPFILLVEKKTGGDQQRYFNPGIAAYQSGDYVTAETDLKQFLSIYIDDSATLYNLGLCKLAEGKKGKAREYFQRSRDNYGQKGGPHMCGSRPCGDLAKEMMTWMDQNPRWEPSQSTTVPPFPAAA